jgi:hypothetical protein
MAASAADKETRQQASRERLAEAVDMLRDSEGWQQWLRARSAFREYSLNNQLLIVMQCPQATRVAGYKVWRKLGYQVRGGERAIRILAPQLVPETDETTGERTGRKICVGFFDVSVFDVAQTNPTPGASPLPLKPPSEPIVGDSHAHLLDRLTVFATEISYGVDFDELDDHGPQGWCNPAMSSIVISKTLPPNAQVRVLIHELTHALGVGYEDYGRCDAEVIVDAVTYVVCDGIGLDVSGESIPYVTGWDSEEGGIRRHADLIDALAKRIEAGIGDPVVS